MNRFALAAAALSAAFAALSQSSALADDMKPVAVLSLSGYDELMADVGYIGVLADQPGLVDQIEGGLKLFTQGQGLKGLDQSKPWGATLQTDGANFQPLVFLPVSDSKALLGALGPMIGEPEEEADGVMSITIPGQGQKVYLKSAGGWLFLGQTPEGLAALPKDPTALLGTLPKQYDIGIRINMQNVPEMYRTMAVDQIRAGVEQQAEKQEDEDEETYAARKKLMDNQVEQFTSAINETDTVTLGWTLESKEPKKTYIDLRVTAVPGSKMAKQLTQIQDGVSEFAGFVNGDSAVTANFITAVSGQDLENANAQIDAMKKAAESEIAKSDDLQKDPTLQKVVKEVVSDLLDVWKDTLKAGKMDGGINLQLGEEEWSVVVGAFVANPKKVEDSVKKLADLAKKDKSFEGEIKLNAAKEGNITFHTLSYPIPDDQEEAKKLFGDKLEAAIGIGPKQIYLAAGDDYMKALKIAMAGSSSAATKKVAPFRMSMSLGSILEFANSMNENPMVANMASELSQTDGKDHITLVVKGDPKDGSAMYRITAEEGVLQVLGKAGKMASGAPVGADN